MDSIFYSERDDNMGFEIKSFRQEAIDKLSQESGKKLEISSNLTSPSQFILIEESYAHSVLGDEFTTDEKDLYLRITLGYNAEFRKNIVDIGKTPEWMTKTESGNDAA